MSLEVQAEVPDCIEAYSMKIPSYWTADPQICFVQFEARFAARDITAQCTMYHYIVGSLTPEIATELRDLLLQLPEDSPYDVLNLVLIERTAASEQCRLQQLFTIEDLGDQKPMQLLH